MMLVPSKWCRNLTFYVPVHTCYLCRALLADSKNYAWLWVIRAPNTPLNQMGWTGPELKRMSKTISCKVCVDCSLGQKRCHSDKRDPQISDMLLLHWPYWTLHTTAKLVAWLTMTIHTAQQNNYDLNYILNNYLILTVCLSCDAAPTFTHAAK